MMPPIGKREFYIALFFGVLAVNVVVGWHFYDVGKRKVALKATQDSLSVVEKHGQEIQWQRDALATTLAEQIKRSIVSRTAHEKAKEKVTLHGDTAVTKDTSQVLLPEVADRLRTAEQRATDAEAENATLKLALHTDTLAIDNYKDQVRLNQNIAKMVQGSRFSRGVQVGVGVCYAGIKKEPCAYVGYGFEVKL